jgi:hypothetical protein
MVSSGLLRRVDLVRTDVSEEPGASFIRVTKIGELGTTQTATSNRRTLRVEGLILSVAQGNVIWNMSKLFPNSTNLAQAAAIPGIKLRTS